MQYAQDIKTCILYWLNMLFLLLSDSLVSWGPQVNHAYNKETKLNGFYIITYKLFTCTKANNLFLVAQFFQ